MLNLDSLISKSISDACNELFGFRPDEKQISIQSTRAEFKGERTVVVFPFTRLAKKSPEETGEAIGKYLVENQEVVTGYGVVKGFLNLSISDKYWTSALSSAV